MLDYFEPKRKRGRPRGSKKKKDESTMFVTEKTTRAKSSGEKVEKSRAAVSVDPHDAGLLAMSIAASIHEHNGAGKNAGDAIEVVDDIPLLPETKKTVVFPGLILYNGGRTTTGPSSGTPLSWHGTLVLVVI